VNYLAIGLGGFVGAIARYGLSGFAHRMSSSGFPLGTLVVNALGCLLIGALAWCIEDRQMFSDNVRLLLRVGFLGSFTTFSTFGFETIELLKNDQWAAAITSIAANVVFGLLAVVGGWAGAKALLG
jgi:CrcB protein